MPFEYFGYILHTTVTNLHCVSVGNLCSLWGFGKCLLVNGKQISATFVDTTLVNGG